MQRFKKNGKFSWCQEEPQNMGAWNSARNYIQWTLDYIRAEHKQVNYIGRKPAASPATGYLKKTSCAAKGNNRKGIRLTYDESNFSSSIRRICNRSDCI